MYARLLEIGSQWAAILTAAIAALAYGRFLYERRGRRIRLENHLKAQKVGSKGGDHGQRSIIDLVAALGMTETEIMDAAFRSTRIKRAVPLAVIGSDPRIALEYSEQSSD